MIKDPRSFFESNKFAKERDRVFMVMPFNQDHSDDLWKVVESVCGIHRLEPIRADRRVRPNLIISDILEEIERAGIILVDLSGNNPNVLYELGIAHVRCRYVMLLCQEGQELPFDLSAYRCIFFDLSTPGGRRRFFDTLYEALEGVRTVEVPVLIKDLTERTNTIVKDLQELWRMPDDQVSKQTVWFSGTLSAFALDPDEEFSPDRQAYKEALQREKESLKDLARRGCTIKCILAVPNKRYHKFWESKHVALRLRHLREFLNSRKKEERAALQHIDWIKSEFRQKNMYIIGRNVCLEGFKRGDLRGYSLTFRQEDRYAVDANIVLYEALFEQLERAVFGEDHTLRELPVAEYREQLRLVMIEEVEAALELVTSA